MTQSSVWSWNVRAENGETKVIQLVHGDLCDRQEECDVVVCSAFKRDYIPTPTSLIGRLWRCRGISVDALAADPELDLRHRGCWLSKETDTIFHRIACVELLEYGDDPRDESVIGRILRLSFSTLNYVLEQAEWEGISLNTVAMPILGTGDQGIDAAFMMVTMIAQCRKILQGNPAVKNIVIYERDRQKAEMAVSMLNDALLLRDVPPQVFFSYSSKQYSMAKEIYDVLCEHQISCWMAPKSIPAGEDYTKAIPPALNQVEAVLLLLTPEAVESYWVSAEVNTALGAHKLVVPYQPYDFPLGMQYSFMLINTQIEKEQQEPCAESFHRLADVVLQRLEERRKKA